MRTECIHTHTHTPSQIACVRIWLYCLVLVAKWSPCIERIYMVRWRCAPFTVFIFISNVQSEQIGTRSLVKASCNDNVDDDDDEKKFEFIFCQRDLIFFSTYFLCLRSEVVYFGNRLVFFCLSSSISDFISVLCAVRERERERWRNICK